MRRSKRLFDIAASTAGLVVLSPLLLLLSLVVKGLDGGNVLFVQERVGRGGRTFRMLKFRTMRSRPDSASTTLTVGNDPRITAVGRWLRLTKLDELPQLLNVLRGEMTFVGPRPEVPSYAACYDEDQRRVLDLVPGITDPASLKYWNEAALLSVFGDPEAEYVKQIMPEKILINLAYASGATFTSDLRVILATLSRLLLGRKGAALAALPRYESPEMRHSRSRIKGSVRDHAAPGRSPAREEAASFAAARDKVARPNPIPLGARWTNPESEGLLP